MALGNVVRSTRRIRVRGGRTARARRLIQVRPGRGELWPHARYGWRGAGGAGRGGPARGSGLAVPLEYAHHLIKHSPSERLAQCANATRPGVI